MKKIFFISLLLLSTALQIDAGHHFETETAKKYPNFDMTDLFVFQSAEQGKTVFIMAFNPQTKKDSELNYSDQGFYRLCIGADKDFNSGISPAFAYSNGNIQLFWSANPEPAIDDKGEFIAEGTINRVLELDNGMKLFSGEVMDLFAGNSLGIGKFRNEMLEGNFDLSAFDIGEKGNRFSKLQSTVIVLEVPNSLLPETIYYYAASAIELEPDHWHRVNRIAQVLFPHTFLLDQEMKEKYLSSSHRPETDVQQAVYENVLKYVTAAGFQKDAVAYTDSLVNIIYPDIMRYKVGTKEQYTIPKRNGRPLQTDAMNISMALLIGMETPYDDKVSVRLDRYTSKFPYVVPIASAYEKERDTPVKIKTKQNVSSEPQEEVSNGVLLLVTLVVIVLLMLGYFIYRRK